METLAPTALMDAAPPRAARVLWQSAEVPESDSPVCALVRKLGGFAPLIPPRFGVDSNVSWS